ncbi:hypothetical protein C8J57DRAFT_1589367 [Mycena rebaudengoi]|nr:hypothetical protein C8J57DRAFT_1589367 [Mycena rebaudengoi]
MFPLYVFTVLRGLGIPSGNDTPVEQLLRTCCIATSGTSDRPGHLADSSFMPGPTKVTGVHWRTSTVTGNQWDMMDTMDKITRISDVHCTAISIQWIYHCVQWIALGYLLRSNVFMLEWIRVIDEVDFCLGFTVLHWIFSGIRHSIRGWVQWICEDLVEVTGCDDPPLKSTTSLALFVSDRNQARPRIGRYLKPVDPRGQGLSPPICVDSAVHMSHTVVHPQQSTAQQPLKCSGIVRKNGAYGDAFGTVSRSSHFFG